MKKTLLASAVLLLSATLVQAEEGKPGVEISGDARFRAVYRDNFDFGNHNASGSYGRAQKFTDSRFRVQFKATTAGGAYAVGRIYVGDGKNENNDTDTGATAPDTTENVWVDRAYIMVPFGDAFSLQAGKYRVTYGSNFFYNDLPSGGVRGFLRLGDVEINPFVEWQSESQASSINTDRYWDHDSIRYGLHMKAQLNDNWHIGGLAAYQTDDRDETFGTAEHKGWLASVYFEGKEGPFGIKGEFAYNDGSLVRFNQWWDDRHDHGATMNDGTADDGFGAYLTPSYTWDALTLSLTLAFTHGGFSAAPEFGYLLAGADHAISVLSVGEHGEWLMAGLSAKYAITDSLSITGNVMYADIDGFKDTGVDSMKRLVEVSGVLDYTITKGVNFSWFAGVLIPSFSDPNWDDTPATASYIRLMFFF